MTVLELIERVSARLDQAGVSFGHGTTRAFDEAAWLVLWALKLPLDDLESVHALPVNDADEARVMELVQQRVDSRVPTAYLTGEAWLQGVPFEVDPRVIIPRSLIAEVIADGIVDPWLSSHTVDVLDLCTGNGSLAVLAALAWPEVRVQASDISAEALAVAQRNVQRHGLSHRIQLFQGDGLSACPGPHDLILCNPPYVNRDAMARLPAEYRAEPALALDGGIDGMDFIRHLMRQLAGSLKPEGVLVLEIGHERHHFEAAFPHAEPIWLPTHAGDDQVLLLTRDSLPS